MLSGLGLLLRSSFSQLLSSPSFGALTVEGRRHRRFSGSTVNLCMNDVRPASVCVFFYELWSVFTRATEMIVVKWTEDELSLPAPLHQSPYLPETCKPELECRIGEPGNGFHGGFVCEMHMLVSRRGCICLQTSKQDGTNKLKVGLSRSNPSVCRPGIEPNGIRLSCSRRGYPLY